MKILKDKELQIRSVQHHEDVHCAIPWYQDKEVLYFSEGDGTEPYDIHTISRMYSHLSQVGELYMIEICHNEEWLPIGDVTLSREMVPIVIGEQDFRGKGYGKRVIALLIQRAKELNWKKLKVNKIYTYNEASRKMFEGLGFIKVKNELDEKGREYESFELEL